MNFTLLPGYAKRELSAVMLNGRRCRMFIDGEQVFPDNRRRVRRLVVDLSAVAEGDLKAVWRRGMDVTEVSSGVTQYMSIQVGNSSYCLNSTFGAYPLAQFSTGGIITFQEGVAPLYADAVGMKALKVKIVLPRANSSYILGTSDLPEPPQGTKIVLSWLKGQTKVSAGCGCSVTSMPSGKVLLSTYRQANGHNKGWHAEDVGEFPRLAKGDEYAQVYAHLHNTTVDGAYLAYPYVNTTISLPIVSVE